MPYISQDFIKDLQEKIDIVQTINKRVKLIPKGNDYKACCPFHQEKTPSFTVSSTKQAFYCFGCGAKGYLIDFVMQHDNLNYVDAIEQLALENGIEVEYDTSGKTQALNKEFDTKTSLISLSTDIATLYKNALKHSEKAISYAKGREISGEIAKRFNLGYAPHNWQTLVDTFSESKRTQLIELGLIKHNVEKNRYYDLFVDRLMFPIYNNKSQVIAFGGRTLEKDGKPKYLNSPASPIFDKSATLYGLDVARKYSKKLEYLLIVEGYMDVVSLHSNGITRVVATLGTATTAKHIELLKRSTGHIIFCFDGDTAGKNAAHKALLTVLPFISSTLEASFLFMPDGADPDDMIKAEGLIKFEQRIKSATKLSEFLFELATDSDFDTIEGKTRFVHKVYQMINLINYPIYKSQLLQGLADYVNKDIETIEKEIFTYNEQFGEAIIEKVQKNFEDGSITNEKNLENHNNTKVHLAGITQIILNFPEHANEDLLHKIKTIEGSSILLEVITNAMLLTSPHYFDLIHIFKKQEKLYNRLIYLAKNIPKLSPQEANIELSHRLNLIEKSIDKAQRTNAIADIENLSPEDRQEFIKNLVAKKRNVET